MIDGEYFSFQPKMDVSFEYFCFFLYLREIFQHKLVTSSEREITLFD